MTRRPNMSAEQREKITDMRENRGMSYRAIAEELGIHHGSVSWFCHVNGIERRGKPRPCRRNVAALTMRNGHPVRAYTPEDDRQLLALEAEGLNYHQIAKRMGRKRNSVLGRLATLARREAAEEACNV